MNNIPNVSCSTYLYTMLNIENRNLQICSFPDLLTAYTFSCSIYKKVYLYLPVLMQNIIFSYIIFMGLWKVKKCVVSF